MTNTALDCNALHARLSEAEHWEAVEIPHNLSAPCSLWAIRECNLLHLMSVWIGATYVSVLDAAMRTGIAVRPVADSAAMADPEHWDLLSTPHGTNSWFGLWAIRESDLLKLLSVRLGVETSSVSEASKRSQILVRPVGQVI